MIQRKNVCDSCVEEIITKIRNKELVPGDKLPNEKDMAEEYGVSRISLREALRYLSAKGLIVTRHGEGSFVNAYDPNMIVETFYNFSLLASDPILEMLEIRKIMETESAKLCAKNATDDEIAKIKEYKEQRENTTDQEQRYEYDRLFHLAIAQASHNDIFMRFIETIYRTVELHQRGYTKDQRKISNTTAFHNEILTAIESRDQAAAADAMYAHIDHVLQSFKVEETKD